MEATARGVAGTGQLPAGAGSAGQKEEDYGGARALAACGKTQFFDMLRGGTGCAAIFDSCKPLKV